MTAPRLFRKMAALVTLWTLVGLTFLALFSQNCFASEPQNYLIKSSISEKQKKRDAWFARDKFQHLMASALVVGLVTDVLRVEGGQAQKRALWLGVGVSFSLGAGKELYDRSHPGHVASWRDLAADLAGIALGVFCFARR